MPLAWHDPILRERMLDELAKRLPTIARADLATTIDLATWAALQVLG